MRLKIHSDEITPDHLPREQGPGGGNAFRERNFPRDAVQQFRRAPFKNLPKIAKAGSGSRLRQMRLLSILPVPAA